MECQAGEQQPGTYDHTLLEGHVLDKHQQHLRIATRQRKASAVLVLLRCKGGRRVCGSPG